MEIGALVRRVRERAALSQANLAERIGMDRANLIRIEKGRINLTVETLVRVAAGLDATIQVDLRSPPSDGASVSADVADTGTEPAT